MGLNSEITNILVTKSVVYVKLPYIQKLLEEYPLPVPLLFFCDDRPYWCLSTCKISWFLLLLFSHYERFKVFKLNFPDVLPVRALSNVQKSNLEFKSFPMTPVSWSYLQRDMDVRVFPGMQKTQNFRQP